MRLSLPVTVAVLALSAGAARSQCSSYPYTLTNGTAADANQVMANFNCAALLNSPQFVGLVGINITYPQANLDVNGSIFARQGVIYFNDGYNSLLQQVYIIEYDGYFALAKSSNFAYVSTLFQVDMSGNLSIAGSLYQASDAALKTDVAPLNSALDKILALKGVSFHWKDPGQGTGEQIGVIAQDVEKVFPQAVRKGVNGYETVDYSQLVAPLIEAVKSLKAENDKQAEALSELTDEFNTYKKSHP